MLSRVRLQFGKVSNCIIILSCFIVVLPVSVFAQLGVIRAGLQSGVSVVCRPSYQIFLECSAVPGKPLTHTLSSILSDPTETQKYANLRSAGIPLSRVRTSLYPQIFWSLFEQDMKNSEGWWHIVPQGHQLDDTALGLWSIALTGTANRKGDILKHPKNIGKKLPLSEGTKIFFPVQVFSNEVKEKFAKRTPKDTKTQLPLEPIDTFDEEYAGNGTNEGNGTVVAKDLQYGKDTQGEYALYKLKGGETIYATIVRFTDYSEHADILKACEVVKKRNKIINERTVKPGTSIKIPIDMLSDIYQPGGKEERRIAEEVQRGVTQLKKSKTTVKTTDTLKGIVVIIDPGHGGRDHGAPREEKKIFEDEINYDIACRLKEYLEQKTRARVYITLKDESQGFKPTSQQTFNHDTDEYILVTPPHNPQDKTESANLRWLLANSIINRELKAKISREKMIFVSIHCDAIYKSSMRGLMIYTPGANYYKGIEKVPQINEINYGNYQEWKEHRPKSLTISQRIDAEARSKTFAQILIATAKKNGIAVHSNGPAIRNVIRKNKYSTYVPSVLRNTDIPTKVLIECANLGNNLDLKNVADPNWRQKMAETIAEALSIYFAP